MSKNLQIGSNLTPVPHTCSVLRLARLPKDFEEKGRIPAIQLDAEFELSSKDKESVPPHLSVWVESLTTAQQAYNFLQENAPNSPRKLVLRLEVSEIRNIIGSSGDGSTHSELLNVIWVYLWQDVGKKVQDCRPGAEGHSGIIGLDETFSPSELNKKQAKLLSKDLHSKLAEIASKDCFLLTELS